MSDTLRTVIESLPAELYREIFDYFHAHQLFFTFGRLNSKIDKILAATNIYLNLENTKEYIYFVDTIRPSLYSSLSNVKSLKLQDYIFVCGGLSMSIFTQLRSLKLAFYYYDKQLSIIEQISQLNNLESLEVNFCKPVDEAITILWNLIVFGQLRTSLRRIVLTNVRKQSMPLFITPPTHSVTYLEYAKIELMSYNDFFSILPCLEHVKSISISLVQSNDEQIISLTTSTNKLRQCLRLQLRLDDVIEFEQVEILLRHTPEVKQLKIVTSNQLLLIERHENQWQLLLQSQCRKLVQFELKLQFGGRNVYRTMQRIQSTFETSFWLERHVEKKFEGHPYTAFIVKFNMKSKSNV